MISKIVNTTSLPWLRNAGNAAIVGGFDFSAGRETARSHPPAAGKLFLTGEGSSPHLSGPKT